MTQFQWHEATTGGWRCCPSLEVVSSMPDGSTNMYRFLCGFICVSLCQSINIEPTNMYIASARAQFKINIHGCWNWHIHIRIYTHVYIYLYIYSYVYIFDPTLGAEIPGFHYGWYTFTYARAQLKWYIYIWINIYMNIYIYIYFITPLSQTVDNPMTSITYSIASDVLERSCSILRDRHY